jgi:hypothetical protein
MKKTNVILSLVLLMIATTLTSNSQTICNPAGNLVIYSTGQGGIININVDVNIPNLKIGICNEDASTQVNIIGTFSSNVTGVVYAHSGNNFDNCGYGLVPTITGVAAGITTINAQPTVGYTPYHGYGLSTIQGCNKCDTLSSALGYNTSDQVVYYFTQATGGVFRSHHTQVPCWFNQTFSVSAGGNCCTVYPTSGCAAPTIPVSTTSSVNLTICAGASANLSATSSGTINWYATNTSTSVLSTGNSFVTPTLSIGTYTYYAEAINTCSISPARTPITFTVNAFPSLSVSPSSTTVCLGQTATLTASGALTYTWNTGANTSSITTTPAVNTTYTVTGANGLCVSSITTTVNVSPLPTVNLTANSYTACTDGANIALNGTPSGGTYSGANVVGALFTPGAVAGTFTPNYAYTNTVTGCSKTATNSIIVSPCNGLANNATNSSAIKVYPNPNSGIFTIELTNGAEKSIQITDLTGRVVLERTTTENVFDLNITALENGIYYVKVQSRSFNNVFKLIKQ